MLLNDEKLFSQHYLFSNFQTEVRVFWRDLNFTIRPLYITKRVYLKSFQKLKLKNIFDLTLERKPVNSIVGCGIFLLDFLTRISWIRPWIFGSRHFKLQRFIITAITHQQFPIFKFQLARWFGFALAVVFLNNGTTFVFLASRCEKHGADQDKAQNDQISHVDGLSEERAESV